MFSIGAHLLFLALLLLAPAERLVSPPPIEVQLIPPPVIYPSLSQAMETPSATRTPTAASTPSPRRAVSTPALASPVAPITPPIAAPALEAAPTPAPQAGPSTPEARPAGPSAAPRAGPAAAGAVNALRQTFGCSSGMRRILTLKEQADCEKRGAERAKDLPDRSGDTIPKYKRDYYDALVAVRQSPDHIPGTDCMLNPAALEPKGPVSKTGRGAAPEVAISSNMMTCVGPLNTAGPKPPAPTLKDLGLAH